MTACQGIFDPGFQAGKNRCKRLKNLPIRARRDLGHAESDIPIISGSRSANRSDDFAGFIRRDRGRRASEVSRLRRLLRRGRPRSERRHIRNGSRDGADHRHRRGRVPRERGLYNLHGDGAPVTTPGRPYQLGGFGRHFSGRRCGKSPLRGIGLNGLGREGVNGAEQAYD
jgi:hypothetical protein